MKLLDWMQHKFRQTNNEPITEFAPRNSCACLTGQPSLDDLQFYPKSNYYTKKPYNTQKDIQFRKSFACIETARADNNNNNNNKQKEEEESDSAFSEIFHGFLAIGTLATETVTNEPMTPTFANTVENIMGRESEATENELKLISDELEKVLEHQGKEDGDKNDNETVVCPLQDYLFGSVVGMPETRETSKKEHRTSLGELFQKTKEVGEITGAKKCKFEKQKEKETEKSAVNLMKKILKGRSLNSSSRRSTSDKKSHKILQMFNRKVHPEGMPVVPKSENNSAHLGNLTEYKNRNKMVSEDIILYPHTDTFKKGAKSYMPHSVCCMNDSDGNRECWIKSDADYLVLEL